MSAKALAHQRPIRCHQVRNTDSVIWPASIDVDRNVVWPAQLRAMDWTTWLASFDLRWLLLMSSSLGQS